MSDALINARGLSKTYELGRRSLEVLRGCTQGCRFCQAGMTTRPVRERSLPNLDALMRETLDATGYEDVSLVSLSTCDYSRVRTLVDQAVRTAKPRNVSVSLPGRSLKFLPLCFISE